MKSDLAPPSEPFDVCVAGAGPVGLSVAIAAAERGLSVLVIEAGSDDAKACSVPGAAEILDPTVHAPLEIAIAPGIGGTSKLWGGRCVPFDDIDFVKRDYLPNSGWPVSHREISAWYPEAAQILGCGSAAFDAPDGGWDRDLAGDVTIRTTERWVPVINTAVANRSRLAATGRVTILSGYCLDGCVVRDERIIAAEVEARGVKHLLRARAFVLACGGLETTRILLKMQRRRSLAFGGSDGPLGRFYMGHMSGKIADIVLQRPADIAALDFFRNESGYSRRRFSISAAAQLRERLLNVSFCPDNPRFFDAAHGNPLLSAAFLALTSPLVGRWILPEAVRLSQIGPPPHRVGPHLWNILTKPHRALASSWRLLRSRYLTRPSCPGFLDRNTAGRYALHYHAEHSPRAESRVTLAADPASPKLLIDLRFSSADANSILRAHDVVDRALQRGGRGRLVYRDPADARTAAILSQAKDGLHQMGTTRMSVSAQQGIVDSDLCVHGVRNLFVASSSVFPTGSQANPTFLGVALAARLGDHLSKLNLSRAEVI